MIATPDPRMAALVSPDMPVKSYVARVTWNRCIPMSVIFELTRKCNLSCVHCYATPEPERPELSTERMLEVIDELRAMGTVFVNFTGGDVTCHPEYLRLFQHASDRRLAIQIFTNAVLFDEPEIAAMARMNIFHIGVSVYGASAETHDAVTRRPGSWAKTMENARRLDEAGMHVVLKFVMMKSNFHEHAAMTEMARRLGLTYRSDVTMTPRDNRDLEPVGMRIGEEELRAVYRHHLEDFGGPEPPDDERMFDFKCGMARNFCSINAYGDVQPCVQMPVPMGNVRERPFREVWLESPRLRAYREYPHHGDLGECVRCAVRPWCKRCPGITYQETGDLYGPSLPACLQAVSIREVATGAPVPDAELPSLVRTHRRDQERPSAVPASGDGVTFVPLSAVGRRPAAEGAELFAHHGGCGSCGSCGS